MEGGEDKVEGGNNTMGRSLNFGRGNGSFGRGSNNSGRGFGQGRGYLRSKGVRIAADSCANCGERGHWRRYCPRPPMCNRCGQTGHMSWDCYSSEESNQNQARISVVEDQRSIQEENYEEYEEFAYMAKQLHEELGKEVFLLDGAATANMVETWVHLEQEQPVDMVVNGLGKLRAVGKGNLVIQGVNLGEALRVPGLGINLISEGALQQQGCKIISRHNWRKIYKNGELLMEATLKKGLFIWKPNKVPLVEHKCFLAGSKPDSSLHLWHLRMGHLNSQSLKVLQKLSTGMVQLKGEQLPFCISCCRSKLAQRPFKGNSEKAVYPYHTIYVDLWGPMRQSIEGYSYALLIVDEYIFVIYLGKVFAA